MQQNLGANAYIKFITGVSLEMVIFGGTLVHSIQFDPVNEKHQLLFPGNLASFAKPAKLRSLLTKILYTLDSVHYRLYTKYKYIHPFCQKFKVQKHKTGGVCE